MSVRVMSEEPLPPPPSTINPAVAQAPADTAVLPTVPGYEILSKLGENLGVVYMARRLTDSRIVALKMIRAGHPVPEQLARFRREAEAVARLRHPNIVRILEVGEHEGLPFYVMEFVDGGDLAQKLKNSPIVKPDGPREEAATVKQQVRRAAELVEKLARAMHFAHQHGIVHRDLKPANILLLKPANPSASDGTDPSSVDGYEIPKITDFGLVKRLDLDAKTTPPPPLTREGAILGTPSYMAPEQADGKAHQVGALTDVYALGAILYELLTGRPPFSGETPWETLYRVKNDDHVPPSGLRSGIPCELDIICAKAFAKEPHRRFASALELAQELERFLGDVPLLTRPERAVGKLLRKVRRQPVTASAFSATGLLLLTVAVLVGLLFYRRWQREEIGRVEKEIRQILSQDEIPGEDKAKIKELLNHLRRLAPDQVHQQHQDLINALIGRPRLSSSDVEYIQGNRSAGFVSWGSYLPRSFIESEYGRALLPWMSAA